MRNLTVLFTMVNGDKHTMSAQLNDGVDLNDCSLNELLKNKFFHDFTTEDGVKRALVINMAHVSHMDIILRDVEDT